MSWLDKTFNFPSKFLFLLSLLFRGYRYYLQHISSQTTGALAGWLWMRVVPNALSTVNCHELTISLASQCPDWPILYPLLLGHVLFSGAAASSSGIIIPQEHQRNKSFQFGNVCSTNARERKKFPSASSASFISFLLWNCVFCVFRISTHFHPLSGTAAINLSFSPHFVVIHRVHAHLPPIEGSCLFMFTHSPLHRDYFD